MYPKYFISKLSDCSAEAAETRSWLGFAVDHAYITTSEYEDLGRRYDAIQGQLVQMMTQSSQWCRIATK